VTELKKLVVDLIREMERKGNQERKEVAAA